MKRPRRELLQKFSTFLFLFWAYASTFIFHYRNKGLSSSICDVKVYSLLYNLLYHFCQFPVSIEHLKLRKQKMADLLLVDHHRAPRMDRWAIYGTVRSVTNCQSCTNFSICYLCANVSTLVFMSSSIIMCN